MIRGDVIYVGLSPATDPEADKRRRCLVVSNDGVNSIVTRLQRGVITVLPITDEGRSGRAPFHVLVGDPMVLRLMGLTKPSKIQAEQVRTVSFERLGEVVGHAPTNVIMEASEALRFHLAL